MLVNQAHFQNQPADQHRPVKRRARMALSCQRYEEEGGFRYVCGWM
jgi:hypothetical protein